MRVYAWCGMIWSDEIQKALDDSPWIRQAHFFVAVKSKAAAARAVGEEKGPRNLFNLGETGNAVECAVALAEPGRVFVRSMQGGFPKAETCFPLDRFPEGKP